MQKKIAIIGIPGKWSTEILADAIEKRTGFRLVIDMAQVKLDLSCTRLFYQGVDLSSLDALIIKKISAEYNPNTLDRLELLRILSAQGIPVFSDPEKILRLIDRLSCTISLRNANIPMPATTITEDITLAADTIKTYQHAVLKPLYSTKARGMMLLDGDDPQLLDKIQSYQQQHPMLYIQQQVTLPGYDLGLVFLAGKYLGAYARVNQSNTWNTTINSGGKYAAHSPNQAIIQMAQKAQDIFTLDFTTVDVAETEHGAIVFEVSAFGGFKGALEGINIDAASLYSDYVLQQL